MRDRDRFEDRPDLPAPEYPGRDEYAPDSVGALPAGVRIRCEPCGKAFRLIAGPADVLCPNCGVSLEARRALRSHDAREALDDIDQRRAR